MTEASQGSKSPYYPVFLDVRGRGCVVVGGGSVAARKVRGLVEAGASVTVVSPEVCADLDALADAGAAVEVRRRPFEATDLDGAVLAIAATDDPAVNEAVSRAAQARGIPVNVVDRPVLSTFIVPATVGRGRLQVAVSTAGASPAFARRLRERIEGGLDSRLAEYLEQMAEARALVLDRVPEPEERRRILEALASEEFVAQYLEAEPSEADEMFYAQVRDLIARAERASEAL